MRKFNLDSTKILRKFNSSHERAEVVHYLAKAVDPFTHIENASLEELFARIGDARIVLLGESTHGTSEFYKMRSRITQELILKKGFNSVALEADWPDVELVNRFSRHLPRGLIEKKAFKRFPCWMWKNEEFHAFILWLRHYHATHNPTFPVNLYGLDLYNLYQSIAHILAYLDQNNPSLAQIARQQYECLLTLQKDLVHYGWEVLLGKTKACEDDVISMLIQLLESYATDEWTNEEEFLPIFQNALSIANAEEYYRSLYQPGVDSWNLRDRHMFETIETLMSLQDTKIVIWAHNSHVGNAAATDFYERGQFSLGQLCKEKYGEDAYLIGFGTHKGTVAAAASWGGKMQIKEVKASHPQSIERLFHDTQVPLFFLPLQNEEIKEVLMIRLLHRAIGVIYQPENELISHYLYSVLPCQFDEYIWLDHTHAVTPLSFNSLSEAADTYPFGI